MYTFLYWCTTEYNCLPSVCMILWVTRRNFEGDFVRYSTSKEKLLQVFQES